MKATEKKKIIKKVVKEAKVAEPAMTEEQKFNYKVTDEQFWSCMMLAFGICNRAAKLIKREYGIEISRMAVSVRANKRPDLVAECKAMMFEAAVEVGMDLLHHGDKKLKMEAFKHITTKLGGAFGWSDKVDTKHSGEVVVKTVTVEHKTTGVPFANNEKDIQD